MIKVLVTGREGQLVRSLRERSQGRTFDLVAAGRPELDLERPETITAIIRDTAPDVVLNAAAYTAVDAAEDEPDRALRINAIAAGELAASARRAGARIIQISTDYVFDGTANTPYDESAPTNALGVYGRSKWEGEKRVAAANPDHLIVRTSWVYSPFGRNFLKTMMLLAQSRDRLAIVSDQRGNPSNALDLADGLLAILDRWAAGDPVGLGRIYHLAGTGIASWAEFAAHILAECARSGLPSAGVDPIATSDWPTKAPRPAYSAMNCSRFERDFGFAMPDWRSSTIAVVQRLAAQ